jgi:CheY-like chemotaxis protein
MSEPANEIFYVDDSPDDRLFAEHMHRRGAAPFTLRLYSTGFSAILDLQRRAARQLKLPGLIVADHYMPVMDGPELLGLIRANPAFDGIALATCSGGDDLSERRAAAEAGAQFFLGKPLDLEQCRIILLGRT